MGGSPTANIKAGLFKQLGSRKQVTFSDVESNGNVFWLNLKTNKNLVLLVK